MNPPISAPPRWNWQRILSAVCLMSLSGLVACGGLSGSAPGETDPSEPAGQRVQLQFRALVGNLAFSCQSDYGAVELHQLKLFLHDLRLLDGAGHEAPLSLVGGSPWQRPGSGDDGVVLLDFEDGTGHCKNGTPGVNVQVLGTVTPGAYTGLRFKLGVPFGLNHGDPVQAPPPLTDTTMHWSWQGGYKFFRLDARRNAKPYKVHLGSTGCEGTFTHVTGCARENRAEISLPQLAWDAASGGSSPSNPLTATVSLHLETLLQGAGDGCMAEGDNPGCIEVFQALALDLSAGRPLPSSAPAQTVFSSP